MKEEFNPYQGKMETIPQAEPPKSEQSTSPDVQIIGDVKYSKPTVEIQGPVLQSKKTVEIIGEAKERMSDEEAELAELEYIKQKHGKNGLAAYNVLTKNPLPEEMTNVAYYRDIERGMLWLHGGGWTKPNETVKTPVDYLREAAAKLKELFAEAITKPKATAEQIAESRKYTYVSHIDQVARKHGPETWKHLLSNNVSESFEAEAEEAIATIEGFARAAENAGDNNTAEKARQLIQEAQEEYARNKIAKADSALTA